MLIPLTRIASLASAIGCCSSCHCFSGTLSECVVVVRYVSLVSTPGCRKQQAENTTQGVTSVWKVGQHLCKHLSS